MKSSNRIISLILLGMLLVLAGASKAETIFETFDDDPSARGWINAGAGSTTFTYNDIGYLDASVCRDSANPARYYKSLTTSYDKTAEFWWQMDCQLINASTDDWARALFGVFNSTPGDYEFLGTRFASPTVGNRYDLWRQYSNSAFNNYQGPTPIPADAIIRVSGHYWYADGNGFANMDVCDIEAGLYYGSISETIVVGAGETLDFDIFGLGNRTDGGLTSPTTIKIDNFYFSTDNPNPAPVPPSFNNDEPATETSLTDVFAIAKMDSLDVTSEVSNATPNDMNIYIRHRAYADEDTNNPAFVDTTSALLNVPAGVKKSFNSLTTSLAPNLWSPESPNLYMLRTEVLDGTMAVLFQKDTLIGFRTFEMVGKHFYLNGKPIYMFSFHMTPKGRIPEYIYNDPDFITQHVERLKQMNIKFVRLGEGVSQDWFEACDRIGVMVMAGCYSGAGTSNPDQYNTNLAKLEVEMPRVRNHPSVIMWYLGNEWKLTTSGMRAAAENIYYAAQQIDSSRPMFNTWTGKYYSGGDIIAATGSDFLDYHTYTGWYNNSIYNLYNYHTNENFPVLVTECIGAYTNYDPNDGTFTLKGSVEDKYLSNLLRHTGHSYDSGTDSLWYQAYISRELVEMCRRVRGPSSSMCGPQPFTYGYFYSYIYDANDINEIAKPIMYELAEAYRPIHVSIRNTNPNHYLGDSATVKMFVLNDDAVNYSPSLPATTLYVDLLDADSSTVWSNSYSVPAVDYYNTWSTDVTVVIPPVGNQGTYTIKARLNDGGGDLVITEEEIFVAAVDWPTVKNSGGAGIALYDSAAATASELSAIGLSFTTIANFTGLAGYDALIIGKDSFEATVAAAEADILTFINSGKRVLILEQNSSSSETAFDGSSWLGTNLKLVSGGEDFVNMERPYLSALMDGMERSDFRIWNANNSSFPQNRKLFSKYIDYDKADLDVLAVLGNAGYHVYKTVLAEVFPTAGAGGSCIISQLYAVDRFKDDPKAAKYLANLIDYFLEAQPHYQYVQVRNKIEFGNVENEAGLIFNPMLQGMALAYGRVPDGAIEAYARPGKGRNFRGEMKLESWGGYLLEDNPANTEICPMYLKTCYDIGNTDIELDVENVYTSSLDFRVKINGITSGWFTVNAGQRNTYSFSLGSVIGGNTNIKLEIESDEGSHIHGYSRGLVFHSIELAERDLCDFNSDCNIDFADLAEFCQRWLQSGSGIQIYDFNTDNIINFIDYATFGNCWPGN